ncbi:MAG TPA: response regulator, partial [Gemmatimonadales bacterium]|nr:response regulator [Gemmatimonadales bacterium]
PHFLRFRGNRLMMTSPPRKPATVLIVDDEAGLRRVLERFLERQGYRVLSAGAAESAYEILANEEADALLLDIHLPTMSGLALYLAIIHRWPALEGHIAIMTGDAEAQEVRTWLDHHHCTVIRKPFNLKQVADWVSSSLQQGRASDAMDA